MFIDINLYTHPTYQQVANVTSVTILQAIKAFVTFTPYKFEGAPPTHVIWCSATYKVLFRLR